MLLLVTQDCCYRNPTPDLEALMKVSTEILQSQGIQERKRGMGGQEWSEGRVDMQKYQREEQLKLNGVFS